MKKIILLALGIAASSLSLSAQVTTFPLNTENDFKNWEVVEGTSVDKNHWSWNEENTALMWTMPNPVPATFPDDYPIIKYSEQLVLTAGTYYISAFCTSSASKYDEGLQIILSENENFTGDNLKIVNTLNCYGSTGVNFRIMPSSESNRKITLDESKTYYLGVRACKECNGTGGLAAVADGLIYIQYITVEKDVDYPATISKPSITIEGANNAVLTWNWPTKTKNGSALSEVGAYIYRAPEGEESGIVDDKYKIHTIECSAHTETKGTYRDENVTPAGNYFYAVVPFDKDGNVNTASPYKTDKKWIGEDVKTKKMNNIYVELKDKNTIQVYFENQNPNKGENDGYIDTSKVKYILTRTGLISEPKEFTIEFNEGTEEGGTYFYTFIDSNINQLDKYEYNVRGIYNDDESSLTDIANVKYVAGKTYSKSTVVGGTLSLIEEPYEQNFEENDAFDLLNVKYTSDRYFWQLNNSAYGSMAMFNGYSDNKSYVYMPPLSGVKDVTYTLTFKVGANKTGNSLIVLYGDDPDNIDNMKIAKTVSVTGTQSGMQEEELQVKPENNELFFIGFGVTPSSTVNFYLDDIKIEGSFVAPGPITNLALDNTPDENIENKATISFNLPSVAKSGSDFADDDPKLMQAIITRFAYGDSKTTENPSSEVFIINAEDEDSFEPGDQISYVDDTEEEGYYKYSVVVMLENETVSTPVESDILWIGYDYPRNVNISTAGLVAKTNKKEAVVSWTIYSNMSTHDGYIDYENLTYKIYRSDNPDKVIGETKDLQWTDNSLLSEDLTWGKYTYDVEVVNKDKVSNKAKSNSVVGGHYHSTPDIYLESFTDDDIALWDRLYWGAYQGNLRVTNARKGDNVAYLPPFILDDEENLGCEISFVAYRSDDDSDADYVENGEIVELYLYDLNENGEPIEALKTNASYIFPDIYDETLIESFNVTGVKEDKQLFTKTFDVPAPGRYRLGLKMASEANDQLMISRLTIDHGLKSETSGIDNIVVKDVNIANGEFILPEGAVNAEIFNLAGIRVASLDNGSVNLSDLVSGIYIIRVTMEDGSQKSLKFHN